MAGLVPAIHVFPEAKTWMPGTRPGMTGDAVNGIVLISPRVRGEVAALAVGEGASPRVRTW
jgi:hypothetical protein